LAAIEPPSGDCGGGPPKKMMVGGGDRGKQELGRVRSRAKKKQRNPVARRKNLGEKKKFKNFKIKKTTRPTSVSTAFGLAYKDPGGE